MRRRRPDPRPTRARLALVAVGAVAALAGGCSKASPPASKAAAAGYQAAGVLSPPRAAPPLALRDYLGRPVNIASFRGKAVFVTFLYTHCPDVCPLITSNLRVAQNLMGPKLAAKTKVIAVSVDPRGDTRATVAAFLARHQMTGRMLYLLGSARELAHTWREWGVGSERDAHSPDLVEHSGLIYGIAASGRQTTIYAANFKPADVAHDAALLASR